MKTFYAMLCLQKYVDFYLDQIRRDSLQMHVPNNDKER